MAEIVDVVNQEDEVIRQAARERCHNEKLIHRGVAVMVFRSDDMRELLLQRRTSKVAIKPDYVGLTGGHVLAGESYTEAAEREYNEELHHESGKEVELEELFKVKKSTDGDHEFVKVFRAVDSGLFDLNDLEVGGSVLP
ncbi:MAG: NUDIX domain-containing protein [Candidatus Nanohaloarchaea archaeon]